MCRWGGDKERTTLVGGTSLTTYSLVLFLEEIGDLGTEKES